VYWIRRAIVGLIAAALVIGMVRIVDSFFSDNPTPATSPVAIASLVPTTQATIATEPSTAPTPTQDPDLVDPLTSLEPTLDPADVVVPEGYCTDEETSVKVAIDTETLAVGKDLHLTMTVKNTSSRTCKRDVGSGANEITIISGPALVWSTDHCNPSTETDPIELEPGQKWSVKVTWNSKLSAKGCQISDVAEPGAYWAHARNSNDRSDGVRFVIE
jgi:hypothetical protein